MKPIKIQQSSATAGYLILSAISVMAFSLAFRDTSILVFAVPILLVFVLGASINTGDVDEDLEAVGWSDKNINLGVPLGLLSGVVALFLGSLIMEFTPQNISSIVPDFSALGKLVTASIIPPTLAMGMNILSQWLIIAPSEESLSKILAPFMGMSWLKNVYVAYIFGLIIWIAMHIPTFIMQGTSGAMYAVLAVLGTATLAVYFITRSLTGSIIGHASFNSGVVLLSGGVNIITYYIIGVIAAILVWVWLKKK